MKLLILLILTFVSASLGQQVCPPPDTLAPCECIEFRFFKPRIACEYIRDDWDIKATFDNFSSLIDSDVVFEELWIRRTFLFEIPSNAVTSLKFKRMFIIENYNLEYIAPDSFGATRNVTTEVHLWYNNLKNAEPYERDLFDCINQFPNVETVYLFNNAITSVPSDALVNLVHLKEIAIDSNNITRLGSRIFTNLTSLSQVYMFENDFSNEDTAEDTFEGVPPTLSISFESNTKLNFLDEAKFKTLLDAANITEVGGKYYTPNGWSDILLECDERADWICSSVEKYRSKLFGFLCSGGIYGDVWEYCGNATLPSQ